MIKRIRIPEERKAVVIGRRGETKRLIEKRLDVKITMDDDISIDGEAVAVMDAENVIRAIGRGVAPECALLLTKEEYTLFIIALPKNERDLKRVRSRIIGTGGKARRNMERLTGAHICVYGKTVTIIGQYDQAELARQAIEKLMSGFSHRAAYDFLEREIAALKAEEQPEDM